MSPELIVSVAGFALTFGTMLYKFGRLEGTIETELRELKRRVTAIEGGSRPAYERV